jgi:hypothetical protein
MTRTTWPAAVLGAIMAASTAWAQAGDPQLKTDHPWYPGELSCSTFERLFKTQSELYTRVTGRKTDTDEDKALASWYWRNLHVFHCTQASCDYWGTGYTKGDMFNREYWKGLFAYGYGICGETHSQWEGEMNRLLGPCRSRTSGVPGHNSFEVYLTGGEYGAGKWVLLDQDISTVIFDKDGKRLMSIAEIAANHKEYTNPNFQPERQRGWRSGGLADGDPSVYRAHTTTQLNGGYAAVPPMLHLRRGESLRRYLKPGLEDGKTFVFWGINLNVDGIPGPAMHSTWVNQPEKMYQAKGACGCPVTGPARFANAVYTYVPNFKTDAYKDGVIDESRDHVTFEFHSPYIIAAAPANPSQWGIYEPGGTNGLVLRGRMTCPVQVSIDQGRTWKDGGNARDGMDLTDLVKGTYQYLIRFGVGPAALADSGLTMRTVCQSSSSMIPRLKDGGSTVTFLASGLGVVSAGPNKNQARVVDGRLDTANVTVELATPRREKAVRLHVGAHVASGNPPDPNIKFQIEVSTDAGASWKPVVKDWSVVRRPPEAPDFFALGMVWGEIDLKDASGPVRVRCTNNAGRPFLRVEEHLVYKVARQGSTAVTFAWKEAGGVLKTESRTYAPSGAEDSSWTIKTGQNVETVWVEESAK